MKLQSIRWQLPLSYAAIALIATLALGAVLLTTLNSHYARLERDALYTRAENVSRNLGRLMSRQVTGQTRERLYAEAVNQIRSFAFLTDTRMRFYDIDGTQLVDTGSPRGSFISIPRRESIAVMPPFLQAEFRAPPSITIINPDDMLTVELMNPTAMWGEASSLPLPSIGIIGEANTTAAEDFAIFTTSSPYGGFDFIEEGDISVEFIPRSNESVSLSIQDIDANPFGTLEVTESPAIGRDIVEQVAEGWLFSGGIAIFLAGFAGWLVSRRITQPLLTITEITQQMTDGDLSVRTEVNRRDELGILATAFNEMASRIEDTVTTLRRFVADAAHELNTPLTALRTNLELALESPTPVSMQRALTQVSRLEGLAGDLLDLSRLEAIHDQQPHELVDLNALIQETSIVYASRAEQADINFTLDLDTECQIHANANQLQRLLANLLDNAIKFTPQGGTVNVSLKDDGEHIKICVKDTGIGIPKEDLPHLFSRFHRARNTNTYAGSGLGLAIVKAIVDAHDGQVYAESNGHGTRMMTILPVT